MKSPSDAFVYYVYMYIHTGVVCVCYRLIDCYRVSYTSSMHGLCQVAGQLKLKHLKHLIHLVHAAPCAP